MSPSAWPSVSSPAPRPALLLLTVFALLGVVLAGCQQREVASRGFTAAPREQAGPPRAFRLGFSALPVELSDDAYLQAWDTAANFGEVLMLARPPSWGDFLPGATPSAQLVEATLTERAALDERNLLLLLALDPFDPADRGRLAALPPGLEGRDLSDPALRQAFVAEARYIALNYHPRYLSLGTEVNAAYERNPDGYSAFVRAYREAYSAVKQESPQTLVFVSFQYEQLLGVIPWEPPHAPRWDLLDDFSGKLDLFAITTYPSFAYSVARKVPPRYYSQMLDHTQLATAIVGAGYASAPGREGLNSSTAAEQRRFVERLFRDVEDLGVTMLIWFAARDPAFATAPPYDLLSSVGLRTADDEPKEAWPAWEQALRRPYDPEAARALDSGAE